MIEKDIEATLQELESLVRHRTTGSNIHLMNNIRQVIVSVMHDMKIVSVEAEFRQTYKTAMEALAGNANLFSDIVQDGKITKEELTVWSLMLGDFERLVETIKTYPKRVHDKWHK